jgi:hypothetical protein
MNPSIKRQIEMNIVNAETKLREAIGMRDYLKRANKDTTTLDLAIAKAEMELDDYKKALDV